MHYHLALLTNCAGAAFHTLMLYASASAYAYAHAYVVLMLCLCLRVCSSAY
jgi:hypothetical protein